MRKSLAGTRIREVRRKSGMTQKALAAAAGVSASYLNLIEHNRRAVAGKVLLAIARALNVPAASLSDDGDSALVGDLYEAAAHGSGSEAETEAIDEVILRFPGWSRLLATLYRQSRDQESAIAALSDRLTHDPFLAESLHSMLSNITAIRSTSNILKNIDDIDPAQQARFHAIIHAESRRLTDAAQALVSYFDNAADQSGVNATPEEALDAFLRQHNHVFPHIDTNETDALSVINADSSLQNAESRALAKSYLKQYTKDAQSLPLAEFSKEVEKLAYDPGKLAQHFGVDLFAVFRRLSILQREGNSGMSIGLIIVNAAGRALFRRPLPDFALPRHGNSCARWPLFQAFSQPDRPISALLELPGGQKFICIAIAKASSGQAFGDIPEYQSAMLLFPLRHRDKLENWLPPTGPSKDIGITCRICPRSNCPTRAEPLILGDPTAMP